MLLIILSLLTLNFVFNRIKIQIRPQNYIFFANYANQNRILTSKNGIFVIFSSFYASFAE